MDLRLLRYFVTAVEERHLGQAAARLNMTQPPLTRAIQRLEAKVGAPLFRRTSRGLEVTNAGKVLLEEARHLLMLSERAAERTRLAGLGHLGRIDIAAFGSNLLELPKILLTFRKRYPNVETHIHVLRKDEQIDALLNRRATVAFNLLGMHLAGIANEKVRSEAVLVAVPEGDVLATRRSVHLADLADHHLIAVASGPRPNLIDFVFALCLQEGFRPQIRQETTDSVTALALVATGLGVCLVPEAASQLKLPNVVFRPLRRSPPITVDLYCMYRNDDGSPILQAFLQSIRDAHRRG